MPKTSAGILLYKIKNSELYVFIVHPGGPFWENKDEGAWSIPKGEPDNGEKTLEELIKVAIRETKEETGIELKNKNFLYLNTVAQKSGKIIHCWAIEGGWPGILMCSSYAKVEWPYKSGKYIKVPEVDKADFFPERTARKKLNPAQVEFIDRLKRIIQFRPSK